ncbi:MAG: hypothetical protein LBE85_06215 [Candidatus Accumulibacter sp.]|nr:hypothetical protein [Accumulibacter sp.]
MLRSVVALYGTQGHATWHFQRSWEVDVVVVGSEIAPAETAALLHSRIQSTQAVLWISDLPVSSDDYHVFRCKPPPRALHLAGQLKQIERFVRQLRARQAAPRFEQGGMPAVRIMLTQWPSPDFLSRDKDFLRMSTMLSARHMTLDELVMLSARPREKCRRFLLDLCREGYARPLKPEEELPPSRAQSSVPEKNGLKGLFGRIRASLGLFSA